jgi:chromosome partitioning protein
VRIAIFNQKGGVGKTTTALNLAAALARRGSGALMVDLDPQAHLTSIHGSQATEVRSSLFAFYQGQRPLTEIELAWEGIGGLIPAHAELIKVDSIFGKGPNVLFRLHQGLAEAARERTVIIDCCPFLGVLSLNALFASDRVLVPVSSDFLSLRGALQIDHTLKAIEPVLKRRVERRYLMTRFDRRRRMSFEVQERLRDQFGEELCTTVISENVTVAEAPALGRDIFTHAPTSRGAMDYAELLDELVESGFIVPSPADGTA